MPAPEPPHQSQTDRWSQLRPQSLPPQITRLYWEPEDDTRAAQTSSDPAAFLCCVAPSYSGCNSWEAGTSYRGPTQHHSGPAPKQATSCGPADHWSVPQWAPPPSKQPLLSNCQSATFGGPAQPLVSVTVGPSPKQATISEQLSTSHFRWSCSAIGRCYSGPFPKQATVSEQLLTSHFRWSCSAIGQCHSGPLPQASNR